MSSEGDHDLEKPESWNLNRPIIREPVRSPRVVVSVAFRRADFALVSEYAEGVGKKTSEFIREAAIDKAMGQHARDPLYPTSSAGTLWSTPRMPDITRLYTSVVEYPVEAGATK